MNTKRLAIAAAAVALVGAAAYDLRPQKGVAIHESEECLVAWTTVSDATMGFSRSTDRLSSLVSYLRGSEQWMTRSEFNTVSRANNDIKNDLDGYARDYQHGKQQMLDNNCDRSVIKDQKETWNVVADRNSDLQKEAEQIARRLVNRLF